MCELTDILIPLGQGSRQNDLELRYCLRSIEKHLREVGNVVIVGEQRLDWLANVIWVYGRDNPNGWMRANNIYRKIEIAIKSGAGTLLSDNFLFMNDDHFLLTDFDAREFPFYHRSEIALASLVKNWPQYMQMKNTVEVLPGPKYDFDVHCPIVYNKHRFIEVFENLEWPEYGYGIKSMYCNQPMNIYNWSLVKCGDLKFGEPLMKDTIYQVLAGRQWFSIGDKCLKSGAMKEVLSELYPNKSKYEA